MPSSPPKKLESLVGFFIPSASREHVLGDLQERYQSPRQYAWDALRVVPMVVLGRILRISEPQRLLLEAASILMAHFAAALLLGGVEMPRVFMAAMIAFTVLVVRDAYGAVHCRVQPMTAMDAALIGWILQLALGTMPSKASLMASMLSAGLVFGLRMSGQERQPRPVTRSLEEVPDRARRFERVVRQRNVREYAAAALVILIFGFAALRATTPARLVPPVLTSLGACVVVWLLYKKGTPSRTPATLAGVELLRFYRNEVERQRALLAAIWHWYLGPFIPGFLAGAFLQDGPFDWKKAAVVSAFVWFVMFGVAWLNRCEAKYLQREIESLDAIERQSQ